MFTTFLDSVHLVVALNGNTAVSKILNQNKYALHLAYGAKVGNRSTPCFPSMARRLRLLPGASGPASGFETPLSLLSTRGGAIPHLTAETLAMVQDAGEVNPEGPLLVPANYLVKNTETLAKCGKGVASFVGLPSRPVVVTPQDPGDPPPSGFTENKTVSVFYRGQRERLTPARYMEAVSAARPRIFVALCDGQTPRDCSAKRMSRSVTKTLDYLDDCIRLKGESEPLSSTLVFGAVEGGRSREWRRWSAARTARRPVDGFLLDGFFQRGAEEEGREDLAEVARLVAEEVSPVLPADKPRMLLGPCGPRAVVDLVSAGVDVFDASFATQAAEGGRALTFPVSVASERQQEQPEEDLPVATSEEVKKETPAGPWIDLKDAAFKEDFSPISPGCACPCCRRHTRAYLAHLLATKELLGPALLMAHNLHHWAAFFRGVRQSLDDESFANLKEIVNKSYEHLKGPDDFKENGVLE